MLGEETLGFVRYNPICTDCFLINLSLLLLSLLGFQLLVSMEFIVC